MDWLSNIVWPGWRGIIEIVVMAMLFYSASIMFRGTRGTQVLIGLIVVVVAMIGITQLFHLTALNWLLRQFFLYAAVGMLIIFQPEIRRALAEIGRKTVTHSTHETRAVVDAVVDAALHLAEQRMGALIAIERKIGTKAIQDTGIILDSRVNADLLINIFFPNTPLHDGGVIIVDNRVAAAACLFPLTQSTGMSRGLGTRHRAAIGLTEETDALVVIVSEETGIISVSANGALERNLDEEHLRRRLLSALVQNVRPEGSMRRMIRQVQTNLGPARPADTEKEHRNGPA